MTVFLLLLSRSPRLREIVRSPAATFGVAAVVGPVIWLVMSLSEFGLERLAYEGRGAAP